MIAFLWAQAANGVIGKDGRLPWHLPDDLAFFKAQTLGQLTVMGRSTWEALPKRPLPGRTNVVMTRQAGYRAPGAVVCPDVDAVLALAAAYPEQDLVVTGGAQVFAAFAKLVDTLWVTRLAGDFDGDVVMPPLDWDAFTRVAARTVTDADPALTHTFETWVRQAR
ncbi:dihydrofolate reductase [Lacticaseibacillus kribbianus]|uniref:dihydrofolate reductase n=1 Tax=Lacticaseibacillus kribbianus TaxID=2926292 RepID=UPI001CD497B1|nr:dihydrofolate reductase [Lacticaseibacillus kribbianus]